MFEFEGVKTFMSGYSALSQGLFAFAVAVAWALILYPLFKFYHKDWRGLVAAVICLSLASIYAKDKFGLVITRTTAGLIGLFLATAVIVFLFAKNDSRFSKQAAVFKKDFSLRGFLTAAQRIEELAVGFYTNAARNMHDPRASALCLQIAHNERAHVDNIDSLLAQWPPKPLDHSFLEWVDKELYRHNIFTVTVAGNASEKQVLAHAIEQHRKIGDFYLDCSAAFPEAWKRDNIQKLVDAEREYETRLHAMLKGAA